MTEYKEVTQEVMDIAKEMIQAYHRNLEDCRIGFVFRSEAGTSGGKTVLGKCGKVPEKIKPFLESQGGLDMLIMIAEDQWSMLNSTQRKALIDHELCHIAIGASGWTTKAHDIEEFEEILQRYGLWKIDLFRAEQAMTDAVQMILPIPEDRQKDTGHLVKVEVKQFGNLDPDIHPGRAGDNLLQDAIAFIRQAQQANVSSLQRHFKIGYPRAARLMSELEQAGVIGSGNGKGERVVIEYKETL